MEIKSQTKTDYLKSQFNTDKQIYNGQSSIKTGLSNFDDNISIRPGTYLIGWLPSVGKLSQPTLVSNCS